MTYLRDVFGRGGTWRADSTKVVSAPRTEFIIIQAEATYFCQAPVGSLTSWPVSRSLQANSTCKFNACFDP